MAIYSERLSQQQAPACPQIALIQMILNEKSLKANVIKM